MIDVGTLVMKVDANTAKFQKGMSVVNKGMTNIGSAMKKVGKTVAIGTAAVGATIGAVGYKALQAGADAEEMRNKYDVVFSGMTQTVDDWSSKFATTMGRSKFAVQESVSNLADLQQGLGMTKEESFDLSKQIVELGTDLASFNNLQDEDAINALSKAMLGEAESAKALGLLLNVDRVKDYAEAQGLVWSEVTDAQRAQLVYGLAVEQSQNAIGDAERSAQSYTNQMKALKTSVSDSVTELGMKLIPVATRLVRFINSRILPNLDEWIDKGLGLFTNIKDFVAPIIKKLIDFAVANFPAMKKFAVEAFEKMKEYGQKASDFFNDKMLPVFDKIKKWWDDNGGKVSEIASDVFNGIITVATDLWTFFDETLLPIFTAIADYVIDNWPEIKATAKTVFDGVKAVIQPVVDLITKHLIVGINDLNEESETALPKLQTTFETVFGNIATVIQTVADALSGIIDAMEKFNSLLPENSTSKFKFSDILNPFGKIGSPFGSDLPIPTGYEETMPGIFSPIKNGGSSGSGDINVNINGNISSDRDAKKAAQIMVDELKRRGVRNP